MATVAFSTLVGNVSEIVPQCPTPIIVRALREAAIESCARGFIWPANLATVVLIAGTAGYIFVTPFTDTVVTSIQSARVNGEHLTIYTDEQAIGFDPSWLDVTKTGSPESIWQYTPTIYNITPVPDSVTTYNLKMRVYLKPTTSATGMEDDVLNDNQELIITGAVHKLLMQPKRPWSDVEVAGYYGKQFSFRLHTARSRVALGFDNGNLMATQRPFA